MKTLLTALLILSIPCTAQVWEAPATGFLTTSPQVATGSVIQATSSGQLTAFSQATGAPVWSRQLTGAALNRPTLLIADDLVVTSSTDGAVYACQLATGLPVWTFSDRAPLYAQLASDGTRLYGGNRDGDLFALDHKGNEMWRVNLGSPLLGPSVVSSSRLFIYVDGIALHARSPDDGSSIWSTPIRFLGANPTPLVEGARVFLPGGPGLLAFTAATGVQEWAHVLPAIASTPATSDGNNLYIGSADGSISAVRLTDGNLTWRRQFDSFISAQPVVDGNALIIATADGELIVLNPADGSITQTVAAGGPVMAAPAQANGISYVPLAQGIVMASRLTT